MNYSETSKVLRNVFSEFNFSNGQPSMFGTEGESITEETANRKDSLYVVIMNHLDRKFFIARSKDLQVYLRNIASFMIGSDVYCTSIQLRRAATERNRAFWSIELLNPAKFTVKQIREKLGSAWRELGSATHISRLCGDNVIIYKITHFRTGWARYSSFKEGREPAPKYIAAQALEGLISKLRKDKTMPNETKLILEKEYRQIIKEVLKDPDSIKWEIMKEITKEKEHHRPLDIIRELNVAVQAGWLPVFLRN